jgi:hypothetical protein
MPMEGEGKRGDRIGMKICEYKKTKFHKRTRMGRHEEETPHPWCRKKVRGK